jgi:hypothetical protein
MTLVEPDVMGHAKGPRNGIIKLDSDWMCLFF